MGEKLIKRRRIKGPINSLTLQTDQQPVTSKVQRAKVELCGGKTLSACLPLQSNKTLFKKEKKKKTRHCPGVNSC